MGGTRSEEIWQNTLICCRGIEKINLFAKNITAVGISNQGKPQSSGIVKRANPFIPPLFGKTAAPVIFANN